VNVATVDPTAHILSALNSDFGAKTTVTMARLCVTQTAGTQVRGGGMGTVRGSVSSTSSSMSMGHAPTTHPPTPPTSMLGPNTGTLRSAASPYRTPAPPVNPPTVPASYNAGHPLAGAGSMGPSRESGYAPGSASIQATPPVRMVPPLQQQTTAYGSPLPPPMHDISQRPYISGQCATSCLL